MNKVINILMGICLISGISNAKSIEKSEEDEKLLALGIIGKDYKYLNHDKALEYFRLQSNKLAKSLPIQVDSYTEFTSSMSTPDVSFYSYRFLKDLTKSQRIELVDSIRTEENLKELCISFFDSRYLIANNHVFKVDYMDKSNKKLVDFTIDKKSCKSTIN